MKRIRFLLIILMSVFFINVEAGDTLTRAQVYNYNVGDTFDYRNYHFLYQTYGTPYATIRITYNRCVISNIYWSTDTLTKYIVRNHVYPAPIFVDTFVLTDLQGYEVILDSISDTVYYHNANFVTSGLPNYFGRSTNFINLVTFPTVCGGPPMGENELFASGLGVVFTSASGGWLSYTCIDTNTLIYYSGDSGTYGTPYTSFPNGIASIPSNESIRLYPTLNDGTFTLDVVDGVQLPVEFSVYDLEGRKVMELIVNDKTNVVRADGLSIGLYIWNVSLNGQSLRNGKIVIGR